MRLLLPVLAFAAVALVAYVPTPPDASARPLAAADTSEWQNLQVLPETISRERLETVMDRFKESLGVQCGFCHVRNGREWDFPSDAKGHKRIARDMMRMTATLNRETLPAIDGLDGHGTPQVSCWTCHRGAARPALSPPDSTDDDAHRH